MEKVNHVAKARRDAGKCRRCGVKIKAGDAYYWFANRLGKTSVRKEFCNNCRPRPSEITMSDKLSQLYGAQEAIEDSLKRGELSFEEFRSGVVGALEEASETANTVAEEYRESRENLPENFQGSAVGEGLEEKATSCEAWQEVLEQAAQEVEGIEQEKICACGEEEDKHPFQDGCQEFEQDDETGFSEIEELASEAAGELEL